MRTVAGVVLCGVAAVVRNERFQLVFVLVSLVYQVSWILRSYEVLG